MHDTITEISSKTTYTGAIAGLIAWFKNVDWLAVVGIILAVLGFAINQYYQWKRNKREEELHKLQTEALRRGKQE